MSLFKFIESGIGLHFLTYNTERTLEAMDKHVNLSFVVSAFVTGLTLMLLFVSNSHKSWVLDEHLANISDEGHIDSARGIISTLRAYDFYLFFQLMVFYMCVYQFKRFQNMEAAKCQRNIDKQSL